MSEDYFNDEKFSEQQKFIKQEEIKMNINSISCNSNGLFNSFIRFLATEKKYSAIAICQAVEKPHAFKKELNDFLKYLEEL